MHNDKTEDQVNKIKIVYESTETPEIFEIVRAEYVDGYRIHLWFNTGKDHIVDFKSFLLHVQNPTLKQYLALDKFRQFTIVHGNLDWNDYEMSFPIADLYDAKILKWETETQYQPA